MIGKKDGKLILCPKCKSKNIAVNDHTFEYCEEVADTNVKICYDVWCEGCKHEFEITDIFTYQNSTSK